MLRIVEGWRAFGGRCALRIIPGFSKAIGNAPNRGNAPSPGNTSTSQSMVPPA